MPRKPKVILNAGMCVCPKCKGSGESRSYGPSYVAISRCDECHGEGKK